jgi:FKBP-type peptidyl-prolyl cis-trans isomerase
MRVTRRLVLSAAATLALGAASCDRGRGGPAAGPVAMSRPGDSGLAGARAAVPMTPPSFGFSPPLDVFAPPADAERDPSGVSRKLLARGSGTLRPDLGHAYVDLRYAGWERNGHQFEGSVPDGTPVRYDPAELAEGVRCEIALMVVGDKRRIWVPADLAYAKRLNFVNAPKGDMTFEIELVHIVPLPPVPKGVAGPAPKEAKTTKSGLAYEVLEKGTGKRHPLDETRAEVTYSAWTPDGKMFQTSLIAGDSAHVRVRLLPKGWREAIQLMVEGDKWRLWLPGKLAFGELTPGETQPPFGRPPGPVVFEVKLLKILE